MAVKEPIQRNIPGLTIGNVISAGPSADHTEAVMIIRTKEHEGDVALKIPRNALAAMLSSLHAAWKALEMELAETESRVMVHPAQNISIGNTPDAVGVLMIVEPETPAQSAYLLHPKLAHQTNIMLSREIADQARKTRSIVRTPNAAFSVLGPDGRPVSKKN